MRKQNEANPESFAGFPLSLIDHIDLFPLAPLQFSFVKLVVEIFTTYLTLRYAHTLMR